MVEEKTEAAVEATKEAAQAAEQKVEATVDAAKEAVAPAEVPLNKQPETDSTATQPTQQ